MISVSCSLRAITAADNAMLWCWKFPRVVMSSHVSVFPKDTLVMSQSLLATVFFFFDEVVTESFLWNWFFFLFYLILSCKQSISVICRIYALRCSDAQTSWTVWAFYKAACTCALHCMRQINVAMMFVQVLVHRWQKSDP